MTRHELYLLAKSVKHAADRLGVAYLKHEDLAMEMIHHTLSGDAVSDMKKICAGDPESCDSPPENEVGCGGIRV